MKKINSFLLGTLALTGLMASCAKEPVAQTGNASVQSESGEKEITAKFVLSVNTGTDSRTRMSADNVQKNVNFLGIDSVRVLAYATGYDPAVDAGAPFVKSDTMKARKVYALDALYTAGQIDAANNATSSSNRILQLSIPMQTDAMLVYGKSVATNPGRIQGKMYGHVGERASETYFDLIPRLGSLEEAYKQTGSLMVYALNRVMSSEVDALPAGDSYKGYENLRALSWQELGIQYEINTQFNGRTGTYAELSPLEENLAKTYSAMTYIKPGEYRAGNSAALKRMIGDLKKVASNVLAATPTSADEANAQRLAELIIQRINYYVDTNDDFLATSTIKNTVVNQMSIMTEAEWNAQFGLASDLSKFPHTDFGLPDGVAQLAYDDTDLFYFKIPNVALLNQLTTFDPQHYMFPCQLAYYVNSPIRVTEKADLTVADFPNGTGPWDDDVTAGNKWAVGMWQKNKKVSSTTRGVAIRDNINYGVALLQTNVAFKAGLDSLRDNRSSITSGAESDRGIAVSDAHFILNGILVGGQNARMNWQFLKRGAAGDPENFDYVVYDDAIASSGIPTISPNYTTVFDNYDASLGDTQAAVNVALEIQNNGDDFWGRDNVIPSGSVFYLLVTLTPSNASNSISWPTNYQIPPIYGVNGEDVPAGKTPGMSKQISRVFVQDCMTRVNITLGENALHNAYVSIPDLRTTQMSLGISVDLSWQTGYQFDIEL